MTASRHSKRSAVLLDLLDRYTCHNHTLWITPMGRWWRRLQYGRVRVMSWVTGVWGMSRVSSWWGRGGEERRPQLPQHNPKPLLIDTRLFLLIRDLDKLAQLLLPHGLPIKVPMLVHVERFVGIKGG